MHIGKDFSSLNMDEPRKWSHMHMLNNDGDHNNLGILLQKKYIFNHSKLTIISRLCLIQIFRVDFVNLLVPRSFLLSLKPLPSQGFWIFSPTSIYNFLILRFLINSSMISSPLQVGHAHTSMIHYCELFSVKCLLFN